MIDQYNLADLTKAPPSDDDVRFALDVMARQAAAPTDAEIERAHEIFAQLGAQTARSARRPTVHSRVTQAAYGRASMDSPDDSELAAALSGESAPQVEKGPVCGKPTLTGRPCKIPRLPSGQPCRIHGTPAERAAYDQAIEEILGSGPASGA